MPYSWQRFLTGLILFLVSAASIGWFYGAPEWGLLAGALAALAWQVRHLLKLEQAIRTHDFDFFRFGEGIWAQIYARFSHLRQRSRKHKRSYQRLLKEVREMTNALPDGGVVLNALDEIELCNLAAQELAGFDARQDRGQRVDNILRDPDFIQYLKSGHYESAVEIPSPVHEGAWLYCRIVPYGGKQKLLLLRDVTERRRLNAMRRDFVANASHELRSPLTVISGYLDALAEDPEAPRAWQKPLEQMRAQADRMTRLVAGLLDLSRLESSNADAADEPVDVPALLRAADGSPAEAGRKPKVEVRVETADLLLGNVAEIESVVRNLLSNALRHTPPDGSVELAWRSDAGGAELVVSDSGEGIPQEYLARITERFFRIDRGRSREDGGVGLGLAIVKHVLERHGAELDVQSTPGAGSRFVCRFPAARVIRTPSKTLAGNR